MPPRKIAQLGRRWFPPGLWEGPEDRKWVTLTFDDAPHPELTPATLDVLRRNEVPATFFVIGKRAERNPDLVRQMAGAGHWVGNHTWSHRPLARGCCVSPEWQVGKTEDLLARLCPGSPRVFRPPFGLIGPGGPGALRQHGMFPVYWSVVPGDWDPLPPEVITARVLREVHPGAVVVLHGGQPWHAGTVKALDRMIRALREREYEIVPLERMLAARGFPVETR